MRPGLTLLLPLLLVLGACTRWPEPGRGGVAEFRAPITAAEAPEDSLGQRLACEVGRLESLQQQAARRGVLTGQFVLLHTASARAQREYQAGLLGDAAVSLDALRERTRGVLGAMPPGSTLPQECT